MGFSCRMQYQGYFWVIPPKSEAVLFNFKAATKEYQDLQPKVSQLQVEFLQQKLLSPGLSNENQLAICQILTAEQSWDTFCAIC